VFADFGIKIYAEMVGVEGKRFFFFKIKTTFARTLYVA